MSPILHDKKMGDIFHDGEQADDERREMIATQHRTVNIWEKEALGLEYWEYKWVAPEELDARAADRWKVAYPAVWWLGKLLMERKRLTDDGDLQELLEDAA